MKKKKNFLILSGGPGCGKTYLCAAMYGWIISNFRHFRVWREYDLLKRIKSGIEKGWDPTENLQYLIDDDLIILDDVGSQGHNEWREKMLFETIDIRYNAQKPTIITTNLRKQDFEQRYHPRIASRLFASENLLIEFEDGDDLRKSGY